MGDNRRHGGGGQDKIQVPEYSGEDDRDGLKARGYIRKVTPLSRGKQARMLLQQPVRQGLAGRRRAGTVPLGHRQRGGDLPIRDQGQVHGPGGHEGGPLHV